MTLTGLELVTEIKFNSVKILALSLRVERGIFDFLDSFVRTEVIVLKELFSISERIKI